MTSRATAATTWPTRPLSGLATAAGLARRGPRGQQIRRHLSMAARGGKRSAAPTASSTGAPGWRRPSTGSNAATSRSPAPNAPSSRPRGPPRPTSDVRRLVEQARATASPEPPPAVARRRGGCPPGRVHAGGVVALDRGRAGRARPRRGRDVGRRGPPRVDGGSVVDPAVDEQAGRGVDGRAGLEGAPRRAGRVRPPGQPHVGPGVPRLPHDQPSLRESTAPRCRRRRADTATAPCSSPSAAAWPWPIRSRASSRHAPFSRRTAASRTRLGAQGQRRRLPRRPAADHVGRPAVRRGLRGQGAWDARRWSSTTSPRGPR